MIQSLRPPRDLVTTSTSGNPTSSGTGPSTKSSNGSITRPTVVRRRTGPGDQHLHLRPAEGENQVVFQRANGTSLYVSRDVAYHLSKFAGSGKWWTCSARTTAFTRSPCKPCWPRIGEPRRPEFVIYQDITVPDGGRMSTRGVRGLAGRPPLRGGRAGPKEVLARREDLAAGEVEHIAEAVATGAVPVPRRSRRPGEAGRLSLGGRPLLRRAERTVLPVLV